MPLIQKGKYGGRMKFRSTELTSTMAEAVAAFNALAFMKSNFSLKIIDRNYSDRLEAEADNKFLLQLLEDSLDLASGVQSDRSNLLECISDGVEAFACEVDFYNRTPFTEQEIEAFKSTALCIKTIRDDSQARYASAAPILEEIKKLRSKLSILKD